MFCIPLAEVFPAKIAKTSLTAFILDNMNFICCLLFALRTFQYPQYLAL